MIKFSHSVFALPFAIVATFLAARSLPGGFPTGQHLALIVLCMVAARSFAMTFNRIVDAAIDARNPRTAGRAIPAGRIPVRWAVAFLLGSGALFILGCAGFQLAFANLWPLRLSLPTLAVLAVYSLCKRFTSAAHFVLGAVIAFAPTAAWIAIHPATLGWPAAILTTGVTLWIAGFDIIYACQDVDVDRRDGLFSIPARLGIPAALWIARICHVLTVALLALLGYAAGLGVIYAAGVVLTAVLLAAEHAVVRANDLSRVNLAFFFFNGCISVLLGTAAVVDICLH